MNETEIYAQVSKEIDANERDEGLWLKAFSDSEGNQKKQEALYIKYRVKQLVQKIKAEKRFARRKLYWYSFQVIFISILLLLLIAAVM